jgi:hypothetical protein
VWPQLKWGIATIGRLIRILSVARKRRAFPGSAERLVHSDQARDRLRAALRHPILGVELGSLGIQDFQKIHRSAFITHACQMGRGGTRVGSIHRVDQLIPSSGVGNESVLGLLEGLQDGLLVLSERCFVHVPALPGHALCPD